jgi:hypothetical protein
MRCPDIERAHARMKSCERIRIDIGRRLTGPFCFVIPPERQDETIALVRLRCHTRIEDCHRAPRSGEALGKVDLELGVMAPDGSNSREDIAGQQAHGELVRIVDDNRMLDWHSQR